MPELIAQGPERRDRWRRRVPQGPGTVRLGREGVVWSVPWDPCVSRDHADLRWKEGALEVRQLATATNPIYFLGEVSRHFEMHVGQHFVIGATTFTLVDQRAHVSLDVAYPDRQQTFSAEFLRQSQFRQAHHQIQVLSRLPEIVAAVESDDELYVRLINLLLSGVSGARAAAVVRWDALREPLETSLQVMHWDSVETVDRPLEPNGSLIREALTVGQSVLFSWQLPVGSSAPTLGADTEDCEWAFCVPLPGSNCRGSAIYVSGASVSAPTLQDELQDTLKFVELVGTTVGSLFDVRQLERRAATWAQFFSPLVRDAVAAADPERALAPREAEITVLFCDLRGFARRTEQFRGELLELLQRVSGALGLVTREILALGGVIGDFHGDAVMGFWGWPMEDEQRVLHGCLAALAARAAVDDVARQDQHPLRGFRVGIGLATGRAVAGKIGTIDQVKVTAFGPVVNLAARLESLTREFDLATLLDAATAERVESVLPEELGRIRPVGLLRPFGLERAEEIFELVPSRLVGDDWDSAGAHFAAGTAAFRAGRWETARECFEHLSPEDPRRPFYLRWLAQFPNGPPPDWDGVIRLTHK